MERFKIFGLFLISGLCAANAAAQNLGPELEGSFITFNTSRDQQIAVVAKQEAVLKDPQHRAYGAAKKGYNITYPGGGLQSMNFENLPDYRPLYMAFKADNPRQILRVRFSKAGSFTQRSYLIRSLRLDSEKKFWVLDLEDRDPIQTMEEALAPLASDSDTAETELTDRSPDIQMEGSNAQKKSVLKKLYVPVENFKTVADMSAELQKTFGLETKIVARDQMPFDPAEDVRAETEALYRGKLRAHPRHVDIRPVPEFRTKKGVTLREEDDALKESNH